MEQDPAASGNSHGVIPVVGIGASAGGLEAVSEVLAALPPTTGMSFVLVQHLDPSHESLLAAILAKRTAMRVVEARDGMSLVPNRLYVIAPNTTLTLSAKLLRVAGRDGTGQNPGLIDTLFRSIATERGPAAAGVLLSGASSDGTRGAQEIKEAGGLVLAQEPESAAFPIMPRSAIDAGAVDAVLRPAEIARRLASLGEHLARGGAEAPDAEAPGSEDELWKRIFRLLRGASGMDFTHYKRSTIERRVARRQALRHLGELAQYAALLAEDTAELNALTHDVLIGVTSFFRDPESFEALVQTVFPALLQRRAPRDILRVWVPACASGEELYSIAICLMEHLGERAASTPVQFFGTDASEAAIARARVGTYPEGIEDEVSPERLQRYFVRVDHHYRVAKPLRDLCVFARHDVTRDPPFSRIDLVSCRNLLIYLDAGLQRQVIAQFHYALNPHGFLLLGPSEAIGASADRFELADKKRRVFRRRDVPVRAHAHPAPAFPPGLAGMPELQRPAVIEADRVQREADRMLLARYAPAAIVVDEDLNVHQFRGETAAYLEHASGTASLNLQQLAPPGLLIALKPALREARTARAPVRREGVRIDTRGPARSVSFEVSPFRTQSDDSGACYLVVFEERGRRAGLWNRLLEAAARYQPAPGGAAGEAEQIKRELAATREFLQSSLEEHEATREELKSLHEEALSSNEELQSTNEELETAKEELQSTNEELATTNDELRARNQQLHDANEALTEARDYAEAIVDTVRHPLLVLDGRLRVRGANPAFYRLFGVDPGDTRGKLLYDLGNRQWDIPELRRLLEETLTRHGSVEDYAVTHAFETLGERTMLLNARRFVEGQRQTELILLGIEDITVRSRAEGANARLAAIVESTDDAIIGKNLDGIITSWNRGAERLFGYTAREAIGQSITMLMPPDRMDEEQTILQRIRRGERVEHYDTVRRRKDGSLVDISLAVSPIVDAQGQVVAASKIARGIGERKRSEESLQESAAKLAEADRRKDEFLAMLGHELRNPLAPIRSSLEILRGMDIRDGKLRDTVHVIDRQTGHMVRLVDDLLQISRIARGTLALDLREMALGDAVARAIEATGPLVAARKHRLNVDEPPQPVRVSGDLVRLTQLVTNLLTNAAKYTPSGGEIRLAVGTRDGTASLTVADNGEGIAADRLPGIFEPAPHGTGSTRGGLGVGLPLARRLAELHGGAIEAKSEGRGKGSAFTVRLPLLAAGQKAPASRPRAAPRRKHDLDGCRVLVVDDNADAANTLQALLQLSGCEVQCAYDAASALPLAEKFDPEVVLLDIALPDFDGYEVLRRLRAAPRIKPAVVALTGYAQPADAARMQEAGFDHSLRKPADGEALVTLIAALRRAGA